MKSVKTFCLLVMLIVGFSFDSHALTNAEVMSELSEAARDVNRDLPMNLDGMIWEKFQFIEKGSRGVPELVFSYTAPQYEDSSFSPELMKELRAEFYKILKEDLRDGLGIVTVSDMRRIKLGIKIVFYNKYHKTVGTHFFSSSDLL